MSPTLRLSVLQPFICDLRALGEISDNRRFYTTNWGDFTNFVWDNGVSGTTGSREIWNSYTFIGNSEVSGLSRSEIAGGIYSRTRPLLCFLPLFLKRKLLTPLLTADSIQTLSRCSTNIFLPRIRHRCSGRSGGLRGQGGETSKSPVLDWALLAWAPLAWAEGETVLFEGKNRTAGYVNG